MTIKKNFSQPLFVVIGTLLIVLVLALSEQPSAVLADATQVPPVPTPDPGHLPGETRAHVFNSVSDCTHSNYRVVEHAGNEESSEVAFVEPPNPEGPVLVTLGLFIIEVTAIDVAENTYHIEGYMDLVWCDPRLAYSAVENGRQEEIFLEEAAHDKLEEIWWPDLVFVNVAGAPEVENAELIILPDGTINFRERFNAELEAHYDLRQFPFDRQILEIEIESFAWHNEYLVLHKEEDKIGFSDEFQIPEWRIQRVEATITEKQEVRDRQPFSEFLMNIEVARLSSYYQWKILLPMAILVAISWSVFWMVGDGLADRMSVSLTGLLTIVAYQFIVADGLPKVSYFTLMDGILTLSFVMMALTIMQNIYVNTLYLHEKEDTAASWDKLCRWLFPLSYFAGLTLLFVVYLL